MFPAFICCAPEQPPLEAHARRQRRKLSMLKGWRDAVERQLAAVNAAIATLEQQMQRDGNTAQ